MRRAAMRPSSISEVQVSIMVSSAPGDALTTAPMPLARSATWMSGPPTNVMRRRPMSSRWLPATRPPALPSIDTDENSAASTCSSIQDDRRTTIVHLAKKAADPIDGRDDERPRA